MFTCKQLCQLYAKGYRYLIKFENDRIKSLAVKTVAQASELLWKEYPTEKNWVVVKFDSDGRQYFAGGNMFTDTTN